MAKRDKFTKPTTRVAMDAVTGKLETVALDDVYHAFEASTRVIENRMKSLSNGDASRLAAKLRVWLDHMVPHHDNADGTVTVVRTDIAPFA